MCKSKALADGVGGAPVACFPSLQPKAVFQKFWQSEILNPVMQNLFQQHILIAITKIDWLCLQSSDVEMDKVYSL